MDVSEVLADLQAEQQALDDVVAGLTDDQVALATPSPRWSIGDQLGHLTYFDGTAVLAICEPDAFAASVGPLVDAMLAGPEAADEATLGPFRAMGASELLDAWRSGRAALAEAAAGLANDDRVAWYGPSMGSKSFLTARLMECWAHGQDIVDAMRADGVDVDRPATDRLRHIAQLGAITRRWSYLNRGLEVPEGDVVVVLDAPSGATWTYGDDAPGAERITGPAEDFCLVVTQRRHVEDTALAVEGEVARDWMARAQAFAGPPTDGPAPKEH